MEVQSQPLAQPLWSNILKQQPKNPPPAPQLFSPIINDRQHGVMVGSCDSRKGISVAVVDANAIIQGGERLCLSADRFVSVPEVIAEIRDPASRHSLNFLPFSVDTLEPSSDALRKGTVLVMYLNSLLPYQTRTTGKKPGTNPGIRLIVCLQVMGLQM
ncbi:RNA-binding NOB1 [Olea europaea subsp. europaea]|uniref:RNA-binding NOB1 n=1 Tax=Olea europaea subsp. europaea TaxID=158383 RepID=A0A8S0PID9_OLEEU|nr:RNA-binding NOB1 [Olea europaea subsp. europaea]